VTDKEDPIIKRKEKVQNLDNIYELHLDINPS